MIEKLIKIASDEVGYLEKKSPTDLYNKYKNAGDNNFTKYASDLVKEVGSPFTNGVPWCVIFAVWCLVKAYGKDEAKRLIIDWTTSCGALLTEFKRAGRFDKSPRVGDLIIFEWKTGKQLNRHTGIVYKVDDTYVYTIEGNTSGLKDVVPNGGGVFKKSYRRSTPKIKGYCHPDYIIVPRPVLNKNKVNPRDQVKLLQAELNSLGLRGLNGEPLVLDGSFGSNTEHAVKAFQQLHGLEVDGSYGPRTAAMLRSILEEEAR